MNNPVGLYIHVPFCRRKCSYCDFYSLAGSEDMINGWCAAVIRNIKAEGRRYDTVYFGGGTPSLLSGAQIYAILSAADIAADAEISAECNPDSADEKKLSDLRSAGINRVSVGVQSLDDADLRMLSRLHSASQAVDTIRNARGAGFENISADLMLGTPYQRQETIISNIDGLVRLGVDHISAYMLKIEESTALAQCSEKVSACADGDAIADYYEAAVQALRSRGYLQYEISNFAKKGYECRHNLKYWRCEDYMGIGPSAHSCIDGKRFYVPRSLEKFISDERQETIVTDDAPCGTEEQMMLALRLSEGFDTSLAGESAEKLLKAAAPLENHGLLTINGGRISLTVKGFLVSNEIICRLSEAME